jgi:type I restriction enzyme R subunit
MAYQTEAALEAKLLKTLSANGYTQVKISDTEALELNFREQLEKHNKVTFSDEEFQRIRNHLDGGSVFEKAKKLRDRYELVRDSGTVYVEFINTLQWCKNLFQVTSQITNRSGRYVNRYDVTILINGLPLVQIELKRRGMEIKEAFNQVVRYKKDSLHVGLFNYIQLFVISNGVNTKYFSNNRQMSSKQIFFWTDRKNKRYSKLDEFTEQFLEPCHLAKMITRYIVLHHSDRILMVLRPYQFYAAESIVKRVEGTTNNGYIWHTTGSGKTLTSFKTSQLLTESDKVDKILFVVDRKDLDYQTTKEFNHFSQGAVEGTENTKSLVRQLGSDNKLVITTIQKLTNAVKKDRHSSVMERVRDKRMIFIYDECHRSQFGEMHKLITGYFTNHQSFGFTGTPIMAENANKGKTTKDLFGDCLHQYVIKDAIDDDNVLGFSVEYYATFKEIANIQDDKVEAIDRQEVMEHTDRIDLVVKHILDNHDRKTFNREFTAILAVANIPLLITYYELLKSKAHDLTIATIFSFGVNEDPSEERDESSRDKLEEFMGDYNTMYGTNFTTNTGDGYRSKRRSNDFNAYYIDVAKKVKDRKIDILIVVNMFLTGFDSPWLNTLYVDKNLKYHGLIQAFSRTNRLKNEKKKHGNIVCYRNLKTEVDKAILLYSNKDALDTVIMKSYEEYLGKFNKLLLALHSKFPDLKAIDELSGEKEKKHFIELFRNILRLKAILTTFSQFSFDDTNIREQRFEDFTSKYRDLYNEVIHKTEPDKVSILDDIDFEIELLQRSDINVDYIISLLKELNRNDDDFVKAKDFILTTISNSVNLKSKKKLIEDFIDKVLDPSGDVEGDLENYLIEEKKKELAVFTRQEGLNLEKVEHLLDEYDFTGRLDEDILEASFTESLGLLLRRTKKEAVIKKLTGFIEKYNF